LSAHFGSCENSRNDADSGAEKVLDKYSNKWSMPGKGVPVLMSEISCFNRVFGSVLLAMFISGSMPAQTPPDAPSQPDAQSKSPVRVASAVQEKKLTKRVPPVYPKEAFDSKLTGVISLEVTIGVDGKVTHVRPVSNGDPLLIKAAEDAVKQWIYKPTVVDRMPVEVLTIVSINFKVGE
jgi:TonB family protein